MEKTQLDNQNSGKRQMLLFKLCTISILCLFSLYSCVNENDVEDFSISVADEFGTYNVLNLSDYVKDIRYIPLETNDSVLLREIKSLIYEDEKIMLLDRNSSNCWVFDNNGDFFRKIGQKGQGPNEYIVISQIFFNEGLIFLNATPHMLLVYDMNGNFIKKVERPNNLRDLSVINSLQMLNSNVFLADNVSYELIYRPQMLLIEVNDDTSKIVKTFVDPIKIEKEFEGYSLGEATCFHRFNDNIRFHRGSNCDTIYTIGKDLEIKDAFIFNFGKYKPTMDFIVSGRKGRDRNIDPITVDLILESSNYLFIKFGFYRNAPEPFLYWRHFTQRKIEVPNSSVLGLYEKNTGKLNLMKQPIKGELGFCNDVDGCAVIWPQYISTKGEIVTSITADAFLDFYDKIDNPSSELIELAEKINPDDNPIIIVAKLKE